MSLFISPFFRKIGTTTMSLAVTEDYGHNEKLIKRLQTSVYHTPLLGADHVMKSISDYIISRRFMNYTNLLKQVEYVFDEETGAVIANICLLKILERCAQKGGIYDAPEDVAFFNSKMGEVTRLFTIIGGRPNMTVRVNFKHGQTNNPAYGYLTDDNDTTTVTPPVTPPPSPAARRSPFFTRTLISESSSVDHYVLMHDNPKRSSFKVYDIHAETFPHKAPSVPTFPPKTSFEISDVTLDCSMEIFSRDRGVLDNVHDYIANDPVPFLVDVVHRGSSLR